MSTASRIEWTDTTWNPVTGCDRISPGCDHCYAATMATRLKAMGSVKYQNDGDPRTSGPGFGVTVHPSSLTEPLRWRTPRRVFVNSMSDLAHARVPDTFIAEMLAVMSAAPQHQFQVLTKRPRRLARLLNRPDFPAAVRTAAAAMPGRQGRLRVWPLPNVWIGTSVESDNFTWRVDELRGIPAAVRFVSAEPLLGPLPSLDLADIDWLIVGGESGPGHRRLDLDWVRALRDTSLASSTAFFFKQVGGPTPTAGGRDLDGRTWDDYPTHSPEGHSAWPA